MLKIRVLGKGLIPRGLGLAPRMNPFNADINLIGAIMSTPGLTIEYLNEATGKFEKLDRKSVKVVYNCNKNLGRLQQEVPLQVVDAKTATPEPIKPAYQPNQNKNNQFNNKHNKNKFTQQNNQPKQEEVKVEETKTEESSDLITPVISE